MDHWGFPGGASGKEPTCQCRRHRRHGFDPWVGKISWRKARQPTPGLLPEESPWTEEPGELQSIESQESDTTERLFTFHFHTVGDDQPVIGPKRSSKAFPKAKLVPEKKAVVTVWWCAAGLIQYSFLNPGETITSEKYAQQIDEMHQKRQCLQLSLVNRKGPVLLHNNA